MIILWLSCQAGHPSQSDVPLAHEYIVENAEIEIKLVDIEAETNTSLDSMRNYHSLAIMESYHRVLGYSDEQCPARYEANGNAFWYGYCTSELGLFFDGYLFYNTYEDTDLFFDGTMWDAQILNASTHLYHQEEGETHYAGNVYLAEGVNSDGADVFFSAIQGSFLIENATEEWFQDTWSSYFTMYGLRYDLEGTSANALVVHGSIPVEGEQITALDFDNMRIFDQDFGYPCPKEPIGGFSVRTTQGIWIDIVFDVEENWTMRGTCDGCGMGTTANGDIYEICLDFSSFWNWEDKPW